MWVGFPQNVAFYNTDAEKLHQVWMGLCHMGHAKCAAADENTGNGTGEGKSEENAAEY